MKSSVKFNNVNTVFSKSLKNRINEYFIENSKKKTGGGRLKIKGQIFDNYSHFNIGKWIEYDENGKTFKETDWDKNYAFSVEDLSNLIKEEYGIDLMKKTNPTKDEIQYNVERNYSEEYKKHIYKIQFYSELPDEGDFYARKNIYVDGMTGKILSEEPI